MAVLCTVFGLSAVNLKLQRACRTRFQLHEPLAKSSMADDVDVVPVTFHELQLYFGPGASGLSPHRWLDSRLDLRPVSLSPLRSLEIEPS